MASVEDDIEALLQEINAEEHAASQISAAADEYARNAENASIAVSNLDEDTCPPDRRFVRGDKEAWVYDHGNICELVFVRPE